MSAQLAMDPTPVQPQLAPVEAVGRGAGTEPHEPQMGEHHADSEHPDCDETGRLAGRERKVWAEDGCASVESWVAMRLGMAWRTAAEMVRVARSLDERPAIAEVFASGALSWDKVRARRCGRRCSRRSPGTRRRSPRLRR